MPDFPCQLLSWQPLFTLSFPDQSNWPALTHLPPPHPPACVSDLPQHPPPGANHFQPTSVGGIVWIEESADLSTTVRYPSTWCVRGFRDADMCLCTPAKVTHYLALPATECNMLIHLFIFFAPLRFVCLFIALNVNPKCVSLEQHGSLAPFQPEKKKNKQTNSDNSSSLVVPNHG